MKLKGRIFKFGDNIDTDVIIPARYLNTTSPEELAAHLMEDADPEFPKKVKKGDIIVAGKNFGCGSSREHAAIAIKGAGVPIVIAESFARIFFRNAFNTGLPLVKLESTSSFKTGDEVEVDLEEGWVKNLRTGEKHFCRPIPPFMMELLKSGGLMNYLKKKLEGSP